MRKWIRLFEDNKLTISDEFLSALRSWGNNTVYDRDQKISNLLTFESEARKFREQQHDWLYRGQIIKNKELEILKNNGSITLNLPILSSWSVDLDKANTFAEFAVGTSIVIGKQNLKCWFDFNLLGKYLDQTGIEVDEDDYDLADPIREKEIIVSSDSIVITKKDIMVAYSFSENGNQKKLKLR